MTVAVEFQATVNQMAFAFYAEGTIYREDWDQPLQGDLTKIQVFQEEAEVTEALTPAMREIAEELAIKELYAQYEREYGSAVF